MNYKIRVWQSNPNGFNDIQIVDAKGNVLQSIPDGVVAFPIESNQLCTFTSVHTIWKYLLSYTASKTLAEYFPE